LTELRMPQPGNGELQLLDQQRAILRLALRRGGLRLRRKQRLALREDDRVGSCEIGRKRISRAAHQQTSAQMRAVENLQNQENRTQPAACGRHVRCGIRQSIPSSK